MAIAPNDVIHHKSDPRTCKKATKFKQKYNPPKGGKCAQKRALVQSQRKAPTPEGEDAIETEEKSRALVKPRSKHLRQSQVYAMCQVRGG